MTTTVTVLRLGRRKSTYTQQVHIARLVCARIDCTFREGVIERYGHCSDGLVGLVRLIAGAGHSEPWETDYSSAAPSRVTHVAQCVVFGAVMADAAMLDTALEMDALGRVRDGDGRRA